MTYKKAPYHNASSDNNYYREYYKQNLKNFKERYIVYKLSKELEKSLQPNYYENQYKAFGITSTPVDLPKFDDVKDKFKYYDWN